MIDLSSATATDAAAALAAGSIGSQELLDAQLDRIERRNPSINAVVALDVDRAQDAARRADAARAARESWGPLHGLPMTVKDAFETEGLVTTSGAPELAAHVPAIDADAVARLKAAGAIVFGKTNLPIYAGDFQTYNDVYGLTRNPWDLDRAVGGSSGGAAAAVASGMTLLELGSDIGGSIRNPSHYCGVFGHKPTWGVVPERGHIPGPPGTLSRADLGVMGPMGRSVADLELGLDVLVGDVLGVPGGGLLEVRPDLRSASDLRVGVWLDDPFAPTDRAVLTVLEAAVGALESAGAKLVEGARPPTTLEEQILLYLRLLTAVVGASFPDDARAFLAAVAAEADEDDRSLGVAMARGVVQSHREWLGVNEARHRVQREWAEVFEGVDVLLTPVTPVAAIPHDVERPIEQRQVQVNGEPTDYFTQIVWAGLATMPLLPATVVPAGHTVSGSARRPADHGPALRRPHHPGGRRAGRAGARGVRRAAGWLIRRRRARSGRTRSRERASRRRGGRRRPERADGCGGAGRRRLARPRARSGRSARRWVALGRAHPTRVRPRRVLGRAPARARLARAPVVAARRSRSPLDPTRRTRRPPARRRARRRCSSGRSTPPPTGSAVTARPT